MVEEKEMGLPLKTPHPQVEKHGYFLGDKALQALSGVLKLIVRPVGAEPMVIKTWIRIDRCINSQHVEMALPHGRGPAGRRHSVCKPDGRVKLETSGGRVYPCEDQITEFSSVQFKSTYSLFSVAQVIFLVIQLCIYAASRVQTSNRLINGPFSFPFGKSI